MELLRGENGYAVISVTDTGIGIPLDVLPKIFEVGSTFSLKLPLVKKVTDDVA